MSRDLVVLVDSDDCDIGQEHKLIAHEQGLLHRAFSIFIARKRGNQTEILLQQRALSKYHCAGLWSNTCCSHPQPAEDVKQSALGRLQEELGFTLDDLTWVGSHTYRAQLSNDLIEHEFDHLFIAWADPDLSCINPQEVNATVWHTISDIEQQLRQSPQSFTPWFAPTLNKVKSLLV